MATANELAQGYAARLRQVKGSLVKTAGLQRQTFRGELIEIFKDIDTYQTPDVILSALDGATGVSPGTFGMLKKSSIQATLQFEQYVDALLAQIKL